MSTNEDNNAKTITLSGTRRRGTKPTFEIGSGSGPTNGTLGSIGKVTCTGDHNRHCTAQVTYTPNADFNGSDSFQFRLQNNRFISMKATVAINVTAVNDAPSFTKGLDDSVDEDFGERSVSGWATNISAGPSNESSQSVSFVATNDNTSLFSTQPAVASNGTLSYTPAADANGTATVSVAAKDSGGTANGGVETSAPQAFTITVNPVNDPPVAADDDAATTPEDTPLDGTLSATDVDGDTLSYSKGSDPSHGSVTVNSDGTYTYTPAADYHGSDSFTFKANDGTDDSNVAAVTITVTPVNDAPVADNDSYDVDEDGTLSIVAPGVLDGDTDIENDALTAAQVSGPSSGTLTLNADGSFEYKPNANFNGEDSFTYKANDGKADSDEATVTITVQAVNDAPSFDLGADQTVVNTDGAKTDGAKTVAGFATNISAGPSDESGQALTFTVTNDDNSLFSVQPDIDETTGDLTYTPDSNATGTATVTVELKDDGGTANGGEDTTTKTFKITVMPPNAAPEAQAQTGDNAVSATEDTTKQITLSATDADGDALTFAVADDPAKGTLGNFGSVNCAGNPSTCTQTVDYVPSENLNGADSFTFKANDGQADSAATTVEVNITAVNDAPVNTVPGAQTTDEDTPVTLSSSASSNALSVSDPDAGSNDLKIDLSANHATLTLGTTNNLTFTQGDGTDDAAMTFTGTASAINAALDGLTYTPVAGYNGPDTLTITTDDQGNSGGSAKSDTDTVAFTINAVNDPPSFTKGADQTANEDSGAHTVTGWATGISAGPSNESGQTISFTVTNDNNSLFSTQPAVASNGNLTYTLAPNAFGSATVTVVAKDNGATANGGSDTSASQTFVINVTGVNDAPSFTKGADQTVNEDSGAQTVTGWATNISAGPNESSGQTVSFTVTNDNNSLFSTQPAVASNGNLTYTPAANANGSATVTVAAKDDGGTASGGVDTSASQTFKINVTAVNDAPSFTKGADQTANEDAGAQSVANWATGISAGPSNESSQTVSFVIDSNDNPSLFSSGPAVAPNGTLTYTPAANQNGVANITVHAKDTGGTANGGVDSSATQSLVITVNPVNDAPVAQTKTASAQTNMKITGVNPGLLSGVTDADSGINGCNPAFSVASISANSGGTVSNVDLTAGTFDFDPNPGFTGTAVVNYTVKDNGCPGTATSAPAAINIAVSGPAIWFVNPAAASNGDGRLSNPFNSLGSATSAMGTNTNHRIFVYTGTTTSGAGVTLSGAGTQTAAQWLIGQGVSGTSFDAVMGITPPTGTIARPSVNGTQPTLQGTVTLGTNTVVKGLNVSSGTSTGLTDPAGAISGVSVDQVAVTTSTGTGVNLSDIAGTLNFGGLTTSGGTGANLTGANSGATFNFTGVSVSSSGANNAFVATGGGTVNVTGSNNTLATTTTGTALNVANTTIGSSGLNFQSISAGPASGTGPTNGIVLNNTGTSGGLTVTGDSGSSNNSSGGTIQRTSGDGISLSSTKNPSFDQMNIHDTAGSGVRGDNAVNNFTFTNGSMNNNGSASGPSGGNQASSIAFNDPTGSATNAKVTGTVTITGNTLTNALWHGVSILQFAGTLDDVNISNNTLTSGTTTGTGGNSFGSGIQLFVGGTNSAVASVTRAELNGNTITNFPGGVLMALQSGTASGSGPVGTYGDPQSSTNDIEVKSNILNGGGTTPDGAGGFIKPNQIILATVNGRGKGNFNIQDNGTNADPLSGSVGNIIDISAGGSPTVKATVSGNKIDASGQTVGGTSGIAAGVGPFDVTGLGTLSTATLYTTVQNNVINNSSGTGIRLNTNAGDPTLNAIVTGNTVGAPISATYGIQVVQGNNAGFAGNTNLQISSNTSTGGTGGGNTFPGIGLRKFGTAQNEFNIVGLTPSPATNAQMESNVSGQNPASASGTFGTGGVAAVNGTSSNWTAIASVPQP